MSSAESEILCLWDPRSQSPCHPGSSTFTSRLKSYQSGKTLLSDKGVFVTPDGPTGRKVIQNMKKKKKDQIQPRLIHVCQVSVADIVGDAVGDAGGGAGGGAVDVDVAAAAETKDMTRTTEIKQKSKRNDDEDDEEEEMADLQTVLAYMSAALKAGHPDAIRWRNELLRRPEIREMMSQMGLPKEVKASIEAKAQDVLQSIHWVIGPSFIDEWVSPVFNKHIYLVGEYHTRQVHCPKTAKGLTVKVQDWLAAIFRIFPTDFFFETEFTNRELEAKKLVQKRVRDLKIPTVLSDIQRRFDHCLQIDKTACDFPNVRMHYVDPRTSWPELTFVHQFTGVFAQLQHWLRYDPAGAKSILNRVDSIIDIFKDPKTPAAWFKVIKVDKQLAAIQDETLRKTLRSILEESVREFIVAEWNDVGWKALKDLVQKLNEFADSLDKLDEKQRSQRLHQLDSQLINKSAWMTDRLQRTYSWFMDAYVLSRIFRSFKEKDGRYSSPQRIIVYSGASHMEWQMQVLARLGFKRRNKLRSNIPRADFQCMDVRSLWPYFDATKVV